MFTYHKTGTVLAEQIMRAVGERFGLTVALHYGLVENLDPAADIVLLAHSLVGADFASRRFRAIRIVRDPRDIWVSGYLYHRRCPEGWCVNTDFDPSPPITYPRVDYSFQHYPESWKQAYLAWLGGRSYQRNLLERDQAAGLAFELAGYTGCTLDAMRGWRLATEDLLDVQLEALTRDFDGVLRAIFLHLGFSEGECEEAIALAVPHDIARMSDDAEPAHPFPHNLEMAPIPVGRPARRVRTALWRSDRQSGLSAQQPGRKQCRRVSSIGKVRRCGGS